MSIDLPQLTQSVAQLSREVGAFILQEVGRVRQEDIQEKDLNSLVSYVDQEAERRIVAGLQARLPTAAFLTEEATVAQTMAPQRWIVDPLDGTTNFLFGLPCFAVSIALEVDGELVLGVVYEPNRDECFTAWQGGGAYCNELPMRVRQSPNLAQALLSTGFPYYDYSLLPKYLTLLADLMQSTRGLRRWGAAAVDLAYLAAGRYDGFFEYSLNAWDIAAGAVLVREAGGIVTDFAGGNDFLESGQIVAGGMVQPALLMKVKSSF